MFLERIGLFWGGKRVVWVFFVLVWGLWGDIVLVWVVSG